MRIIGEIFLYTHAGIDAWLLLHILFPGLRRQNLKDDLRGRPCFPHTPTRDRPQGDAFDNGNIRGYGRLIKLRGWKEGEIFAHCADVPPEEPFEHSYQVL